MTSAVQLINLGEDGSAYTSFLDDLSKAKKVVALTGAGISAESGIPTFRGAGGFWRKYSATELATPEAFAADPSLVWEFYHYRREIISKAAPNEGHFALAALEKRCESNGQKFVLLTQNIDRLHQRAGSKAVVELHGTLWRTRCTHCGDTRVNLDMPICRALAGQGLPDVKQHAHIPTLELPRCALCNGLLRPFVVWFGENLEPDVLAAADSALDCDVMLVVGTSAVVYPAAGYSGHVKARGGVVAEFNIEETAGTRNCTYSFQGPASKTLRTVLGLSKEELTSRDCVEH